MADMNVFSCSCRLGKDPESRTTNAGDTIATFSAAINTWSGGEEKSIWLNFIAFKQQADLIVNHLHKGSRVGIVARYDVQEWEDRETGQKRSRPQFIIQQITFLDSKPKDGQSRQPSTQPSTRQQSQAGGQGGLQGGGPGRMTEEASEIPF